MAATKKASAKKKTQTKRAAKQEESLFTSPLFLHGLIWVIMFVLSALFMYINTEALIAEALRRVLGGLFGLMAYMVPFVFLGTFIYLVNIRSTGKMWIKFGLSVLELIDMASLIGMFADYDVGSAYDMCSAYMNGGGLIGVAVGSFLTDTIGPVAAFLLLAVLFIANGCLIANVDPMPYIIKYSKKLIGYSADVGEKVKRRTDEYMRKKREEEEFNEFFEKNEDEYENSGRRGPKYVPPEDDGLPKSLTDRLRGKGASAEAEEFHDTRRHSSGHRTIDIANGFSYDLDTDGASPKPDMMDDYFDEKKFDLYNMRFDDVTNEENDDAPEKKEPGNVHETADASEDTSEPDELQLKEDEVGDTAEDTSELLKGMRVSEMRETERAKKLTEAERSDFHSELDRALSETAEVYRVPTLDLLDEPVKVSGDMRRELYKKAEQLISVLANFGVKAKPVQVTQGPTVTRYEIQPSSGTKLSKIVNLADDIALNMAVSTVLIAPVPGKAATVGVEIPNKNVTAVKIREMLESTEFINAKSKLTVALGKDIGGNVVVGDIAKWPHALIAGATGSGKSVCINAIITSLLYKADPCEVKLIMIDPKQVELGVYNGIPHLLIPVVTEAKKAAGALNWAVSEMMKRYDLFKESGVRKLEAYNKLMERTGGEKLPQIVIIIDELADLMMVAAKEVEDYICRLAQLARAAGLHLIIATQRPSVDVITGLIKANIPSRIAFAVSQQVDSRTIIDRAGAEKLLGMGDMLYYPAGARATTRVQGAFVSDGEVERIVDYIKSTSPETHYSEDLEEHIERIALGENGVTPDTEEDGDALLQEAIKLAVELGKISTSMIQRRLSVGYSRAGRIMDQMEARGIVSPQNGSKPRDVLISHADMMFDEGADDSGVDQ